MKTFKCWFRFSVGRPANWFYCTICNKEGFNSKLLAVIVGLTILECCSSLEGKVNSLSGLQFWSSAIALLICWSKSRALTYILVQLLDILNFQYCEFFALTGEGCLNLDGATIGYEI